MSRRRDRRRPTLTLAAAAVVLVALGPGLLREATAPRRAPAEAALQALVDDVVADVSQRRTRYREPTPKERRAASAALAAAASGDREGAAEEAAELSYDVVEADAGGEDVLVLRETAAGGRRGWGLYAFGVGDRSDLVIEVPHPVSDRHTDGFGTELFVKARARALLLAGAHRVEAAGSADVAHREASFFEAAHRELLEPDRLVLQLHGFGAAADRRFDAVVSSGAAEPSAEARTTAAALERNGFRVCLYGPHACDDLGGTTNVQSESAARAGTPFVHLELAPDLRQPGSKRDRAIGALLELASR